MSDLIIGNKLINAPIKDIIVKLRDDCGGSFFHDIIVRGDNVSVTCPSHKGGQEQKPSCNIYQGKSKDLQYGYVRCFTCGYSAPLYKMVGQCFAQDDAFGREWLVENFGTVVVEHSLDLPMIELTKHQVEDVIDEAEIAKYAYYHPYMWQRHLVKEVVDQFEVGFDPQTEEVVFPVRDEKCVLRMITRRSVRGKRFHIQENEKKPVYLLYDIIQNKNTTCFVVESQINALTLRGWGYPAVALFGTGSAYQFELLNHCGVRHFITAFDGDDAGRKAICRFRANISKECIVTDIMMPHNKDVNDITKTEFETLLSHAIS